MATGVVPKGVEMTKTFKAVTVTKRGGVDAIRVVERELRPPTKGEVRIRVLATPVCQDDVAIRVGNRPFLRRPPYVPGYSFIGVVDAVGDGVSGFEVGQRVAALTQYDSHAEFIYRAARDLALVPPTLDPVSAATLILNYLVAQQVLHRVARVRRGDTALIVGASGGVGTAFLQLGRLAELRMYGTASVSKHTTLTGHGVTPIDYHDVQWVEIIRHHEPDGLDFVFNGMGPEYIRPGLSLLRHGGILVSYGAPQSRSAMLRFLTLMVWCNLTPNGKSVKGYGTHREGVDSFKEDWAKLFELLAAGDLDPVVANTFPLLDAVDAYERLESGTVSGNLVLVAPELAHLQGRSSG